MCYLKTCELFLCSIIRAGLYDPTCPGLNEASNDFEVCKVVIVYDLGKMFNF